MGGVAVFSNTGLPSPSREHALELVRDEARAVGDVRVAEDEHELATQVNADDKAASARHCAASLKVMQDVDARMVEARRRQAANLINRHAWMAEAYRVNGDIARAIAETLGAPEGGEGAIRLLARIEDG